MGVSSRNGHLAAQEWVRPTTRPPAPNKSNDSHERQPQLMTETTRMPSGPVRSGDWRGPELQQDTDNWLYTLTSADVDELHAALAHAKAAQRLELVSPKTFILPTFGPRLKRLTRDLSEGLGFVLLRGFPTEHPLEDVRLMYFGLSTYMGIPVAQNVKNLLVDNVRNEQGATRGYQKNLAQEYHSDVADMVGLLCIHPAKSGGVSKIMSAVRVHNILQEERPDLLKVLYDEPFYYTWVGEEPEGQLPFFWTHYYSWYQGRLRTRGLGGRARAAQRDFPECPRLSQGQVEALDYIDDIQKGRDQELSLDMDFQPGDVQVLDNSIVWHGRTAFEDSEDPAKRRHLLRTWLNYYLEPPTAPDAWGLDDALGQQSQSPKRRMFDVEVLNNW